jgi:hypothetical protein
MTSNDSEIQKGASFSVEDVLSSPKPLRSVSYGTFTFQLSEPDDFSAVDLKISNPSAAQTLAAAYTKDFNRKVDWGDVVAVQIIRLCLKSPDPVKTDDTALLKLKFQRGGLFNKLRTTAWDLCGLADAEGAIAQALENFLGDLQSKDE